MDFVNELQSLPRYTVYSNVNKYNCSDVILFDN
jgi:hypothetical protein